MAQIPPTLAVPSTVEGVLMGRLHRLHPTTKGLLEDAEVFRCFFFNDTATTEIYTLSLHDALPICRPAGCGRIGAIRPGRPVGAPEGWSGRRCRRGRRRPAHGDQHGGGAGAQRRPGLHHPARSEEHTSELQSLAYLVCRLLLEKKNN